MPGGVTSLKFGFQVTTGNNTKILIWDDVQVKTSPLTLVNLQERQFIKIRDIVAVSSTANIPYYNTLLENSGANIVDVSSFDNTSTGLRITANRKCKIDVAQFHARNAAGNIALLLNSVTKTETSLIAAIVTHGASLVSGSSASVELEVGDFVVVWTEPIAAAAFGGVTITAVAEVEHLLSNQTKDINWEPETNITFEGLGAVSDLDAYRKREGDSIRIRGSVSAGTTVASIMAIVLNAGDVIDDSKLPDTLADTAYVGRGFAIPTTSHVAGNFINLFYDGSTTNKIFCAIQGTAGNGFTKNNGNTIIASNNTFTFDFLIPIVGLDLENSVTVVSPLIKTAYLKDEKSAGTAGGTFTSGAWQTRDLNILEGDTSFISLAANQFTLGKGKYIIEFDAPAYRVNSHKCKIRNITDSVDIEIGSVEDANAGNNAGSKSTVFAEVILNSSKTFELQHRCQTTFATTGFGIEFNVGVVAVYSNGKIIKTG